MTSESIALAALRRLEGCRLDAYQDVAGVWTVGYGHTGPEVHAGLRWTQEQADKQLAEDLGHFLSGVRRMVRVPLEDHEEAALACFAFNVGLGAFGGSTLLRVLNQGHASGVPEQLMRWTMAGGRVVEGLVRRRAAEVELWHGAPLA